MYAISWVWVRDFLAEDRVKEVDVRGTEEEM
jgi:hypothetical protein